MNVRKLEFETMLDNKHNDISKDWLVYGHNDILRTSLIFLSGNNEGNELTSIYKDSIRFTGELRQTFYLIFDGNDKDFINRAKNKNFLSIFFVTLNYDRTELGFKNIREIILKKNKGNIFIYETLDNYDFIVLSYGDSTNEIEENFYTFFNQCIQCILESGYTIFIRDIYKMYTTYYGKINKEAIVEQVKEQDSDYLNSHSPSENDLPQVTTPHKNRLSVWLNNWKKHLFGSIKKYFKEYDEQLNAPKNKIINIYISINSAKNKVTSEAKKEIKSFLTNVMKSIKFSENTLEKYEIAISYIEINADENVENQCIVDTSSVIVENVNIQLSFRECDEQDNVILKIKNAFIGYNAKIDTINGSKDLNISIEKIDIDKLFSLYGTKNKGIFAINSKFRMKYIDSSNLKFLTIMTDDSFKYYNRKSIDISDNFKKFIDEVNSSKMKIGTLYQVDFKRILYSMSNVLTISLSDYSFLSLYLGMKKFVQKVSQSNLKYDSNRSARYFLESCNAIINTSSAIQIGYYPKQEYVSKEVIAPSELMCFYSAFTWKMVETVIKVEEDPKDTEEREFTFCLTPSIKENVAVKALFMNDNEINDRLLLVEIPIKNVYNPEVMLFSLCHEASHYVGEKVRMRDNRMRYIYKAYTSYLMDVLLDGIDANLLNKYSIANNVEDLFRNYVETISKKISLNSYSINLKRILKEATFCLITDLTNSIRQLHVFSNNDDTSKPKQQTIVLIETLKKIRANVQEKLLNNSYTEKVDCIVEIFSESYADLFAILYLGIDRDTYKNCIIKAGDIEDLKDISSDYISIRILANYYANDFKMDKLVGKMKYQKETYESYNASKKGSSGEILSTVFENPEMLKQLIIYLKACKKSFNRYYLDNRKAKHKLDENRLVKGLFNMKLDLATIYDYNKEFRDYIFKDIINSYSIKDK